MSVKVNISYSDQDPNSSGGFDVSIEYPELQLVPSDQDVRDLADWIEANWVFSSVGIAVAGIGISQPARDITNP